MEYLTLIIIKCLCNIEYITYYEFQVSTIKLNFDWIDAMTILSTNSIYNLIRSHLHISYIYSPHIEIYENIYHHQHTQYSSTYSILGRVFNCIKRYLIQNASFVFLVAIDNVIFPHKMSLFVIINKNQWKYERWINTPP